VGADLIFSINELKLTREQAEANAKRIAGEPSLARVLDDLENMAGIGRFVEVDAENPTDEERAEVEGYLKDCIATVFAYAERRDCSYFVIDDDRLFAITAGMSWGDDPTDAFEAYNVCEILSLTEREWPWTDRRDLADAAPVVSSDDGEKEA